MKHANILTVFSLTAGAALLTGCGDSGTPVTQETVWKTTELNSTDVDGFVSLEHLYIDDAPNNIFIQPKENGDKYFIAESYQINETSGGFNYNTDYSHLLNLVPLEGDKLERYKAMYLDRLQSISEWAGNVTGISTNRYGNKAPVGANVIQINWDSATETENGIQVEIKRIDTAPGVLTIQAIADTWLEREAKKGNVPVNAAHEVDHAQQVQPKLGL